MAGTGGGPADSLARLLKTLRSASGLSQEELAERAGLSVQAVGAIERGTRRRPHPQTVRALAAALALSAADRARLLLAAAGQPDVASLGPIAQLPRDVADLTGRESAVADAVAALTPDPAVQATTVLCISGKPGVGKSALAVRVAHELASRFPDGQLYVNLQGATVGLPPLEPLDGLGRILRAFGLGPASIPDAVEEAAARFRSLAAERRLLVVLDNARSAEQVRPLLPGSPTCAALVTSRQVLGTLEGARGLQLDVLTPARALELLARIAGPRRLAAESRAAEEVVRCCGQLPLAIRIAGARLLARPQWPVREFADQLADATRRLDALEAGELAVRASFDVSLQALRTSPDAVDRAAAAAFGLLSLPDGPDLGTAAAARLLDTGEAVAGALLGRLVDAQLLETPRHGRYRFHDLVRLFARDHAARQHAEPERLAALVRLAGYYTASAWQTTPRLRPRSWRLAAAASRWTRGGQEFAGADAALDWLETERANLLAAVEQTAAAGEVAGGGDRADLAELSGQLASALSAFFLVRGRWRDCVHANETVAGAARRRDDRSGLASACTDLSRAYEALGRYDEAFACQREALAIVRDLGDRHAQAFGLTTLGICHWRQGRYEEAIDCLHEGLSISREVGDRAVEAASLNNLGLVRERMGWYEGAIACTRESLAIFRDIGQRDGQAQCLNNLGLACGRLGRQEEAIVCLQECLSICRELGNREGEAESMNTLGVVYGQLERHASAVDCQEASLAIFRELGSRRGTAVVLRDLGDALRATGHDEDAGAAWREALSLCEALQIPQAEELRARLAARETAPTDA